MSDHQVLASLYGGLVGYRGAAGSDNIDIGLRQTQDSREV
jgi:hypothetical protein